MYQINLSNNEFGNYEVVFKKTSMPKLYKIIVNNSKLTQMVNVSDYVADPFDAAVEGTDDRNMGQNQYATPLTSGVPRYYDVANNAILEIPKYYLKINLGFFNLSNNKLGSGSESDPMGVYATP